MAWLMPDEAGPATDELLQRWRQGADVHAPVLLRCEVSNALVMCFSRKRRLTPEQMEEKLTEFEMLSIAYNHDHPRGIAALAVKHGLTVYDASYLELAMRLGLPLATLDQPLQSAARKEGVASA